MAGRLSGKVALVIGAGSIGPGWGNGKATAVAYGREGATVVCVDRNPDAAAETAALVREEGAQAQTQTNTRARGRHARMWYSSLECSTVLSFLDTPISLQNALMASAV